jgi:hypothetical protein
VQVVELRKELIVGLHVAAVLTSASREKGDIAGEEPGAQAIEPWHTPTNSTMDVVGTNWVELD